MTLRIASLALVALVAMMPAQKAKSGQVVASFYGDELRGSPTASGEPFNPDGMTAASNTLPFGTRLLVRHEGRAVVVTVTDRGPGVAGRELDLSRAAAEQIGLDKEGVDTVEVEEVHDPAPTDSAPELPKTGGMKCC